MLVHTVLFSLVEGISEDDTVAFEAGLRSLAGIENAREVFVGRPAPVADRPVLMKDYDFALTVILADVAQHDAYQAHPLHQAFLANFKKFFARVRVLDAQ